MKYGDLKYLKPAGSSPVILATFALLKVAPAFPATWAPRLKPII